MANSPSFQPETTLTPKRPLPTWSAVTICFAAKMGLMKETCRVQKAEIACVEASKPVAQQIVSKVVPSVSVSPR